MKKLFLLKPDFKDLKSGDDLSYFCPDCAIIEGLLSYYPRLRTELEVHYVDFIRPRQALIELLGEENQSCPVLILDNGSFLNEPDDIIAHLAEYHHTGHAH